MSRTLNDRCGLRLSAFSTLFVGWFALSALAHAAPILLTNVIDLTPFSGSVQRGALSDDFSAFLFLERREFILPSQEDVDIAGGLGTFIGSDPLPGFFVPAGTLLNSYLLHANPMDPNPLPPFVFSGSVTFDAPIMGVVATNRSGSRRLEIWEQALNLGPCPPTSRNCVVYPSSSQNGRDVRDPSGSDFVSVTGPIGNVLTFNFVLGPGDFDQVRILEAAVPEPTTLALTATALALMLLVRRGWRFGHGTKCSQGTRWPFTTKA